MEVNLTNAAEKDKFAKFIGIRLVKAEPGYAKTEIDITENHMNGVGIVQGGVTFALADFAFAAASNARGQATVGTNVNIIYFRKPQGKFMRAIAKEMSSSRKLCHYKIDIFDEYNDLIASMTSTGYIKG